MTLSNIPREQPQALHHAGDSISLVNLVTETQEMREAGAWPGDEIISLLYYILRESTVPAIFSRSQVNWCVLQSN